MIFSLLVKTLFGFKFSCGWCDEYNFGSDFHLCSSPWCWRCSHCPCHFSVSFSWSCSKYDGFIITVLCFGKLVSSHCCNVTLSGTWFQSYYCGDWWIKLIYCPQVLNTFNLVDFSKMVRTKPTCYNKISVFSIKVSGLCRELQPNQTMLF